MALGNGNPKQGDKGSNFSYNLKVLTSLSGIKQAIEVLSGAGDGSTTAIPSLVKTIGTTPVTYGVDKYIEVTIANIGADTVQFDNGTTTTDIDPGLEVSFRARPGEKLGAITFTGSSATSEYYTTSTT